MHEQYPLIPAFGRGSAVLGHHVRQRKRRLMPDRRPCRSAKWSARTKRLYLARCSGSNFRKRPSSSSQTVSRCWCSKIIGCRSFPRGCCSKAPARSAIPPDLPGLANMTAAMLKEGTKTRSSKQIAEEIERLGATINASAPWGSEEANLTASGLSDNIGEWLPLAADLLLNPTFPESELNNLKQRMKVQLRQQRSSPFFLLQERFDRAVYGNHPAAITAPTPQSIDKITQKCSRNGTARSMFLRTRCWELPGTFGPTT